MSAFTVENHQFFYQRFFFICRDDQTAGDTSLASSIAAQNKQALRHSGETLKKSVDFPSFIEMMIKLVSMIAQQEDTDAMGPAMNLLVVSVLSKSDLLKIFYNIPDIHNFILNILLMPSKQEIRREAENGLYQLCQTTDM